MSESEHSTRPLEHIDALAQMIYDQAQSMSGNALELTIQVAFDELRKNFHPEQLPVEDAYRALATLSKEHIELLLLSYREGLHHTEIARRQNRPPEDVLRELFRAKALYRFARFPDSTDRTPLYDPAQNNRAPESG